MSAADERLTESAKAYLNEYGTIPQKRTERERYSAFRLGYEAGRSAGRLEGMRRIWRSLTVDMQALGGEGA